MAYLAAPVVGDAMMTRSDMEKQMKAMPKSKGKGAPMGDSSKLTPQNFSRFEKKAVERGTAKKGKK